MWLRNFAHIALSHYLTMGTTMGTTSANAAIKDTHNVLYSLPAKLFHDIMSEWVDFPSIVKLDSAVCHHTFREQHLALLSSEHFYVSKLVALSQDFDKPSLFNHSADTQRLHWLLVRNVKVRQFEFAYNCNTIAISDYLSKFGDQVRKVKHFTLTCEFGGELVFRVIGLMATHGPLFADDRSQSRIIATHCKKLTSYHCYMLTMCEEGFLRVLSSNPGLQELQIEGDYMGAGNAAAVAKISLPNLRQLVFMTKYGFDEVLSAFASAAPNLEKLLLRCNSGKCTELTAGLILTMAQRCTKLRSFSSRELHLCTGDRDLKRFLQICPDIVNLDLECHSQLTDDTLIKALSSLQELHSLNLAYCSKLTDRTLSFLAERFAHTLHVLHIGGNKRISQDAIDALRAKCTQLYTYHYVYNCEEEELDVALLLKATILHVEYLCDDADLGVFATHGQQLQVLDLSDGYRDEKEDLLSEMELLEVARGCPNLRTVVVSTFAEKPVDYSSVKKAYPQLIFTTDKARADFDLLAMPV